MNSLLLLVPALEEGAATGLFGSGGDFFILMIAIVAIFYFVMILPEKKQRQQRDLMLSALKKGDKILLTSGMHGSVAQVKEDVVTVQVADGVRIRFSRAAVQSVLEESAAPKGGQDEAAETPEA